MRLPRILVTGATGFVGSALVQRLVNTDSVDVIAPVRHGNVVGKQHLQMPVIESISPGSDWSRYLAGVDAVVHCAARVHVMRESAADPLAAFRETNRDATLTLARQAAGAGVRRFVFLSSVKVNGESTAPECPFTEQDRPAPQDPYGQSKLEAEQTLMELARLSGMEVVVIRPPLVYGPGVKANFRAMMRAVRSGVPLPLGAIGNKRSFVYIDNLADLIVKCIDHPAAANQVFLASDGEDLSTTELLKRFGFALGRPARLVPLPQSFLEFGLNLIGKADVSQRLCGSLQVNIAKARQMLSWSPPTGVDEGLRQTAAALGK